MNTKKIKQKLEEGNNVIIKSGEFKGEKGIVMRNMGGGYFRIGHPSGHTELKRSELELGAKK
jgi:hypothetical protein